MPQHDVPPPKRTCTVPPHSVLVKFRPTLPWAATTGRALTDRSPVVPFLGWRSESGKRRGGDLKISRLRRRYVHPVGVHQWRDRRKRGDHRLVGHLGTAWRLT